MLPIYPIKQNAVYPNIYCQHPILESISDINVAIILNIDCFLSMKWVEKNVEVKIKNFIKYQYIMMDITKIVN
jgi:hypothetical protein